MKNYQGETQEEYMKVVGLTIELGHTGHLNGDAPYIGWQRMLAFQQELASRQVMSSRVRSLAHQEAAKALEAILVEARNKYRAVLISNNLEVL